MRVLESIRAYVAARLENHVYEGSDAGSGDQDGTATPKATSAHRDIDGGSEMREDQASHGQANGDDERRDSLYPVLREAGEVS